jgi:hypothetical protein
MINFRAFLIGSNSTLSYDVGLNAYRGSLLALFSAQICSSVFDPLPPRPNDRTRHEYSRSTLRTNARLKPKCQSVNLPAMHVPAGQA